MNGTSIVYFPNISNRIDRRPSLNADKISLAFSVGKYINLGTVHLQPSKTGFSTTLVAQYSGAQRVWARLWEFGGSPSFQNIILSRFESSNLVQFYFQQDPSSPTLDAEVAANDGWPGIGNILTKSLNL